MGTVQWGAPGVQTSGPLASPGGGQLGGVLRRGQIHPGGVRQLRQHEAVGGGHSGWQHVNKSCQTTVTTDCKGNLIKNS